MSSGFRWHKIAQRVGREFGAELGPLTFTVYYTLVIMADNESGCCFPAKATIAKMWGMSPRTVDRAVKALIAHRPPLIEYTRVWSHAGKYKSNEYHLLDPFSEAAAGKPSSFSAGVPAVGEGFQASGADISVSSVGKLTVEIVNASDVRVDRASQEREPSAAQSHGDPTPRAPQSHGDTPPAAVQEPFAEWEAVRKKFSGLFPFNFLLDFDNVLVATELRGEKLCLTVRNSDAVFRVSPVAGRIAQIAYRTTGVYRPVEVVAANGNTPDTSRAALNLEHTP